MPVESRWLFVSKPLRPPFRDGSTVLVRALVEGLPPHFPLAYFGDPHHRLRPEADDTVIDAPPMGYAPSMADKARILAALVDPRRARLPLHFFFTPNRITSSVLTSLRRLQPRRTMVQTVMSVTGVEAMAAEIGRLDAVVVASDWARERLAAHGCAPDRVVRIYPGVELPSRTARDPAAFRRLAYAGDLDPPTAARLARVAALLRRPELAGWRLTIACRPKGEGHAQARRWLEDEVAEDVARGRVELLEEVPDMFGLLETTSLQLFLADHVRKKVDLPLVILEGLARGVGLVSLDVRPLGEIFARGAAHGLCPGFAVADRDFDHLLVRLGETLVDPARLRSFGSEAARLAALEFDRAHMVDRYAALYESLRKPR